MRKLSKRHRKAREVADLKMEYPLDEAVALLMKMPNVKFDETVALYACGLQSPFGNYSCLLDHPSLVFIQRGNRQSCIYSHYRLSEYRIVFDIFLCFAPDNCIKLRRFCV